ncbi:recombinase family protein [Nocardia abscessus]|uniref:recombinase family protein n=1 Tax=Nocardia abscessus TaxID=120957 RepID=UPI002455ED14|nr:recombinase family protein [Nocardia abscessus]
MAGRRVLGRIRLSRLTDESTSPERQKELIQKWADSNDDIIIGWAVDMDVSRSISPFDTPEFGRWLREPDLIEQWDIVAAWKLDRYGCGSIALNKLFAWVMEHGKALAAISDNIDLSTWVGRLIASVIAGVAEGELEAIRERTRGGRAKLLESGRWPGGQVPYGWSAVKTDKGWKLRLDPISSKVVRRIVDGVIAGSSIESIANRLNEEKLETPSEYLGLNIDRKNPPKWLPSTIWGIIQSKYLMGHATHKDETVRDGEGRPVLYADPLLSRDEWDNLQRAIAERRLPGASTRTKKTSPLHAVVLCPDCEDPLFHKVYNRNYGKRLYRYYHCRDKAHGGQIDADIVETRLEESFLEELADEPVRERVYIPAQDHQAELSEAMSAVDELTALLGTTKSDMLRRRLMEQLASLDERILTLEKLPQREASWDYRATGETYGEAWAKADTEGRRQLLLKSGITATVKVIGKSRANPGSLICNIRIPEHIKQRMAA